MVQKGHGWGLWVWGFQTIHPQLIISPLAQAREGLFFGFGGFKVVEGSWLNKEGTSFRFLSHLP